jgi:hypothetical protein
MSLTTNHVQFVSLMIGKRNWYVAFDEEKLIGSWEIAIWTTAGKLPVVFPT